jgi:hypothetical protein
MTRREIPTDVIGTSNLVREYTNLNFEECYPITTKVTKTVGAGKDFETFHEAMLWATRVPTTGHGAINLRLDDGVHVGKYADFDPFHYSFYNVKNWLVIESASGNRANCTITMEGATPSGMWLYFFGVSRGGHLTLYQVTLDISLDGKVGAMSEDIAVYADSNARFRAYDCVMKAYRPVYIDVNSYGDISTCTLTAGTATSGFAVGAFEGSVVKVDALTILGGYQGLRCDTAARMFYGGAGGAGQVTFAGITNANTSIPLNQIQYDGRYISTAVAALSFKP